MPRHIACLSFDFDAWSALVARGLTSPTPISRGEFGANVGVPRILRLMRKHAIEATFFVPGVVIESYPDRCREIHDAGHEIGNHGYTHVSPVDLSPEQEEIDLLKTSELILKLTGRKPRGYRSAAFDLSPATAGLLLKHGFEYDSSMMADDHSPYKVRLGDKVDPKGPMTFGKESALIEMPVSWSLDDFLHFEFLRTSTHLMPGLMSAEGVLKNWTNDFRYMVETEEWGVLSFVFHPLVIGRGHRMIFLEKLIIALKEMGAIFMKIEDAAAEFKKRPVRR
ncbi:polysaccharide deacetylase [Bradyrhizobium sp. NP1]|uniref:polysaccharide deacetylase family protein n=1 Tax=Bradyrhizobium sp. NP1 TaxID=3049772 RepID=UPI0025A5A9A6|nr:polysaccharide deacetylase [Bradyrhizobium sp. NP1]WJR77619.1 polysaccharide deacetylase [Bradyrhizobium sp. NP1]